MRMIKKETAGAYCLAYRFPLFDYADEKGVINACITGLDEYSEEFFKAAVWSTQREGYFLKLDVCAAEGEGLRLKSDYPELFDTESLPDRNEIFYNITLYENCLPTNKRYDFVFSSGRSSERTDEVVKTAKKAVILSEDEFTGKFFGENAEIVRADELEGEKFLKDSGIEGLALKLFCGFNKNCDEAKKAFFENEFYYRSSAASMLFWSLRKKQGAGTEETKENMMLEHRRWNAFTRTEGYRFGRIRNDREKTHPCLVAWDMLERDIQLYDLNPIRTANRF
ncbi:MAG: hypothetical protein ACI4KR_13960 [Ruminiclostridium sp.]